MRPPCPAGWTMRFESQVRMNTKPWLMARRRVVVRRNPPLYRAIGPSRGRRSLRTRNFVSVLCTVATPSHFQITSRFSRCHSERCIIVSQVGPAHPGDSAAHLSLCNAPSFHRRIPLVPTDSAAETQRAQPKALDQAHLDQLCVNTIRALAIHDATGVRLTEVPLTPERIALAIAAKG